MSLRGYACHNIKDIHTFIQSSGIQVRNVTLAGLPFYSQKNHKPKNILIFCSKNSFQSGDVNQTTLGGSAALHLLDGSRII